MSLTIDQIVAETSRWPADSVADLVDRITLAKHGGLTAEREAAWAEAALRRSTALASGQATRVPRHKVSARIRRFFATKSTKNSPASFTLPLRL